MLGKIPSIIRGEKELLKRKIGEKQNRLIPMQNNKIILALLINFTWPYAIICMYHSTVIP